MQSLPVLSWSRTDKANAMDTYSSIVALAHEAEQLFLARDYQRAIEAYQRARAKAEEFIKEASPEAAEHPRLLAVLYRRIGEVNMSQGQVQQAVYWFEGALRSLLEGVALTNSTQSTPSIRMPRKQFSPRLSEGNFYQQIEEPPPLFNPKTSTDLKDEENDPALAIQIRLDIGNAYLSQPQEAPALAAYQAALNEPAIEDHLSLKAYIMMSIGEVYRRQQKLEQAEAQLAEAMALFEQHAEPMAARQAMTISAGIAKAQQQFDKALALYQQAIPLYEEAADPLGQGRTEVGLAALYIRQENFEVAQKHYQLALNLAQQTNDQETLWCAHEGLGRCFYEAKELTAAIKSFEESLNLVEQRQKELQTDEGKVTFIDSVKDIYDQLLRAHLDLAQQREDQKYDAALAVAERARAQALHDLMEGHEKRRIVHSALTLFPDQQLSDQPLSDDGQQQQSQQQRQQAPAVPVSARPRRELPNAPKSIEPLTRLVFYMLPDRTAVFVVQPGEPVVAHVSPIGCDDMKTWVADIREQITEVQLASAVSPLLLLTDSLQSLYAELIAPVADALPPPGQILVIEPHASLWLMPFAALKTLEGEWMGALWPMIYAPSHYALTEIRQEPRYRPLADSKFLIVGNPHMPRLPDAAEALSKLPSAEAEAKAIVQILKDYPLLSLEPDDATEANVIAYAKTHNIVHLATHGIAYPEDPLASFVALSPARQDRQSEGDPSKQDENSHGENSGRNGSGNGLLTAREITESRALGLPLDMVVLSACETGLGKLSGDGVLGLSRALLIAGVRTVIVSQWKVADSGTEKLMCGFYQHYIHSEQFYGQPALALQQAMEDMRNLPMSDGIDYRHPRYWSPFIIVGAET